jgi:putative ABC transport system permease protein
MLTTEFVKWVMLSNIIAIPVAYFIMSRWLQDYPYPITMKGWVFGLALTSSVAVALITVIFQSLRAAYRNPVDSLKYE